MAQRNPLTPVCIAAAFTFLCSWEGVSYTAKHERIDPPGVYTVCNGITNYDLKTLKPGDKFTPAMCKVLLSKALPKYDACIQQYVKVDLPAYRHVSMLSYIYNVGCGNFLKSATLFDLNAGRTKQACEDFVPSKEVLQHVADLKRQGHNVRPGITTANHRFLPGLMNRRRAERVQCLRED
jgi:GH24 family phage-related lysozyme (muramidase)